MWLKRCARHLLGAEDQAKINAIWTKHLDHVWGEREKIRHIIKCHKMVTPEEWKEYEQDILVGVSVEYEHGLECAITNVTDDDLEKTIKIAMRHLAEGFMYYRLLITFVEYYQEEILHAPKPNLCVSQPAAYITGVAYM
jgi:hypothetical protein